MLIIYKTTLKEAISTHDFIDSKFIRRVRMCFLYYSFCLFVCFFCQNFNRIYTFTFFFNIMLLLKLYFGDNYGKWD